MLADVLAFGKRKMKNEKEEEKKVYKNKILFLRKSKKGEHFYAFNQDGALGEGVESLIANIAEVKAVMEDKAPYAKVSVMEKKTGGDKK